MKILVVFTGGTIGSSNCDGVITPDKANSYKLLELYSAFDDSVEFVTVQPYNILSENLCSDNLKMLCKCIKSYDLSGFDGVVVTHGTDTLQFTSAFLSYVFGLCKTPIVVVSANYPLENSLSNGLINFRSAVDFIKTGEGRGVFVAYTNCGDAPQIHRASRVTAHSAYSDLVFSVLDEVYGEMHGSFLKKNDRYKENEDEISFEDYRLEENSRVLYVKPYVGMSYPEINDDIKAILLEGYHSGTLNTSGKNFCKFCKNAEEKGIPIFLTGACEGFYYESKTLFDDLKINVLPPASPIAMYVKLWLLKKENIMDVCLPCGGDFS